MDDTELAQTVAAFVVSASADVEAAEFPDAAMAAKAAAAAAAWISTVAAAVHKRPSLADGIDTKPAFADSAAFETAGEVVIIVVVAVDGEPWAAFAVVDYL